MPSDNTHHAIGHRSRLRERFLVGDSHALHEYELLELILFRSIPRRDVKPLAKDLIKRFGDLSGVLAASYDSLIECESITPNIATDLKLIETVALKLGQARIINRTLLSSWDDLINYCRAKMAEKATEEFNVVFMDKKNQVIAFETVSRGTVDHAPVYPREVMKRALQLNASAIVLVHNHPSGDPTPSKADIDMTRRIQDISANLSIRLHDHIIIGKKSEFSFKNLGLIA